MQASNPKIRIRPAQYDDIPFIYSMVKELAAYEKEPDAVLSDITEYYAAFESGLIQGHIAEMEREKVGMTVFYRTFSTWKGVTLYLEDFYVIPEYRQHGIGQQLFDAFVETARQMGCRQTKWQVLDWNEPALRFYEKNGAVIEKEWWNGKIYF